MEGTGEILYHLQGIVSDREPDDARYLLLISDFVLVRHMAGNYGVELLLIDTGKTS